MGNSTWHNALDPFPVARGAAKNTFTTWQDVSPLPLPATYANELKVGTKIELEAWGEITGSGTPTLQLGFIYGAAAGAAGGTIIAASGVITLATTAAAWPFHMQWGGIVTAVGSAAVIYGSGILDLPTSLIAFASSAIPITAAARSVGSLDTTAMKLWGVGAAFGTSAAGNQVIVDVFNATAVNQGKT